MPTQEIIKQAYATAKNFPDLAQKLIDAGVQSYSVDVSSGIIIYRLAAGETMIHQNKMKPITLAPSFSSGQTMKAIRDNQEGKSDYPGFMNAISKAGVRFYDAILNGPNKRVIYVGIGGHYEEKIPID